MRAQKSRRRRPSLRRWQTPALRASLRRESTRAKAQTERLEDAARNAELLDGLVPDFEQSYGLPYIPACLAPLADALALSREQGFGPCEPRR